jgi:hypothetical protein
VLSYALVKLTVYRRILSSRSDTHWIRTDREKP